MHTVTTSASETGSCTHSLISHFPHVFALLAAGAYSSVAERMGLKPKDMKAAVEGIFGLAAAAIKEPPDGRPFTVAGMLKLERRYIKFRPERLGVNPFTKEPCVYLKPDRQRWPYELCPQKRSKKCSTEQADVLSARWAGTVSQRSW